MADLATPSAAAMSTGNSGTEDLSATAHKVKPDRPDEEKYKEDLGKAEKENSLAQEKYNAIKAKLELAKPRDKDSPVAKRQQELRGQLSAIRAEQQNLKSSKGNVQEKIKSLDASLKSRIAEQKAARSRIPFKSVEEVDREIQHLEKQVDTGTMRLVDEKKALSEISSLRKQRKSFAGFEDLQKGIDDVKRQIADLKKGLDDPHSKALSEKYTQIANELDGIKKEQDEAYKGISTLRDERTKLQEEQQSKWTALKAVKDQYYQAKKAFNDWEHEAYRARREKQKTEREAWEKEKRRKVADEKLEQAGQSAYMDEILTAEGLLRYFDPTFTGSSATSTGPSKFAAQATRKVEEDAPKAKGTKLMKKDEENYFMGTGGKKGKKGKKGPTASPAATPIESGKFNLSVGVIEELGKVNVEPPMGQSDVPSVIEKLKEKLAFWKKDQERKTKENVAKAQKEIDRLDNGPEKVPTMNGRSKDVAKDTAKKPAEAGIEPSGEKERSLEMEGAEDAAEDLKRASMEDKET